MGFFSSTKEYTSLGVNVSDSSVKFAEINEKGEILSQTSRPLPPEVIVRGEIKDKESLSKILKEMVSELRTTPDEVISHIPDSKVFSYVFLIPNTVEENAVESFVQKEAFKFIPLSPQNIYYDYTFTRKQETPGEGLEREVFFAATFRTLVEDYRDAFSRAGIPLSALRLESETIAKLLANIDPRECTMLLDIGEKTITMSIVKHNVLLFSESIIVTSSRLKLLFVEENQKKSEQKETPQDANIEEVEEVMKEIRYTFNHFENQKREKIAKIIFVGGGALIPNIEEYFSKTLNVPAEIGEMRIDAAESLEKQTLLKYASALGFAIRSTTRESKKDIDLLKRSSAQSTVRAKSGFFDAVKEYFTRTESTPRLLAKKESPAENTKAEEKLQTIKKTDTPPKEAHREPVFVEKRPPHKEPPKEQPRFAPPKQKIDTRPTQYEEHFSPLPPLKKKTAPDETSAPEKILFAPLQKRSVEVPEGMPQKEKRGVFHALDSFIRNMFISAQKSAHLAEDAERMRKELSEETLRLKEELPKELREFKKRLEEEETAFKHDIGRFQKELLEEKNRIKEEFQEVMMGQEKMARPKKKNIPEAPPEESVLKITKESPLQEYLGKKELSPKKVVLKGGDDIEDVTSQALKEITATEKSLPQKDLRFEDGSPIFQKGDSSSTRKPAYTPPREEPTRVLPEMFSGTSTMFGDLRERFFEFFKKYFSGEKPGIDSSIPTIVYTDGVEKPLSVETAPSRSAPQEMGNGEKTAGKELRLSLGVETFDGLVDTFLERGTPLPATQTKKFTTIADNQDFVKIHVVQGERPIARDNKSIGFFELSNIPPLPRGIPQIEVTFNIDTFGNMRVTAKELKNKIERAVDFSAKVFIPPEKADAWIKTADKYKAEDLEKKTRVKQEAEKMLSNSSEKSETESTAIQQET